MNRGVSSIQKTLKKYGPLRTHSGDIVSFREIKIGLRSSENGAIQDIDFGDGCSTLALVAASVATKTPQKIAGPRELLFLNNFVFGQMQIGSLSSELASAEVYRSAGGGGSPLLLSRIIY